MKAQPLTLPIVISWLKVHLESYLPALALCGCCCEIARTPLLPIGLFVSSKLKKECSRDVFLQNLTAQKKEDNEILLNQIFQ